MPHPNPLFEVVASHWGVESAHSVMQRVIRSRVSPFSNATTDDSHIRGAQLEYMSFQAAAEEGRDRHDSKRWSWEQDGELNQERNSNRAKFHQSRSLAKTSAAPRIPKRQTSLRCVPGLGPLTQRLSEPGAGLEDKSGEDHHVEIMGQTGIKCRQSLEMTEEPLAPATTRTTIRRPHSKIRRVASLFQAPSSPSGPPSSNPVTQISSRNSSGAGESGATTAETERLRGLRGKWSLGGDATTVALTPIVVDMRMAGQDQESTAGAGTQGGKNGSVKSRKGKEKEKRGWGWGGWWP